MKQLLFLSLALFAALSEARSAEETTDSLRTEYINELIVNGVNLARTSFARVNQLDAPTIEQFKKETLELPFLLYNNPNTTFWSDNGVGVGTTDVRIRGAGSSQINITFDGIGLNSPEDECLFWANTSAYTAFLSNIYVQNGVGVSPNSNGSFAAQIDLQPITPTDKTTLSASLSYGAYNTLSAGATVNTPLINEHFNLIATYFHTTTDGFLDGTKGNSGSFYASLRYNKNNISVKLHSIFNYERMGQAWNGVYLTSLFDPQTGAETNSFSYKDVYKAGLGRYNDLVETLSLQSDNTYYISPLTWRDGRNWKATTDNFYQEHIILTTSIQHNQHLLSSLSLHYTYGYGFYDQLKDNAKLADYGLSPFTLADGEALSRTALVRKKGLDQNTFGAQYHLSHDINAFHYTVGVAAQGFTSGHFGDLTYIENEELWEALGGKNYQYYHSRAQKWDANIFAQATYNIRSDLDIFLQAQYRFVDYKLSGQSDKFIKSGDESSNLLLHVNEKYNFFNPKLGLSYHTKHHTIQFVAAISHREPERNNFTDQGNYPLPTPERLTDIETNYSYKSRFLTAGATLFFMHYHDALAQTGELSDIGEALTTNISSAQRYGVEAFVNVNPTRWLTLNANAALSVNRINDFTEVVDDFDNGTQTFHYSHSTLAFSPSCVANIAAVVHTKSWTAAWRTSFVSRQYLDNTASKQRSLPAYTFSTASVSYAFNIRKCRIELMLAVENVFNSHYATNGWVYSAIQESENYTNENRYTERGFFPMAPTNLRSNINISF